MSACLELPSSGVVVRSTDRQAGRQAPVLELGWHFFFYIWCGSAWPSFHLLPCSACGRAVLPRMFLIFRPLYLTITARCLADMLPPSMTLP